LSAVPVQAESARHGNGRAHGLRIGRFSVDGPSLNNGSLGGLVLVAPTVLRKTELTDAGHLLKATDLPLLGVITYATPTFKRLAIRGSEGLSSKSSEGGSSTGVISQ